MRGGHIAIVRLLQKAKLLPVNLDRPLEWGLIWDIVLTSEERAAMEFWMEVNINLERNEIKEILSEL